MEDRSFVLTLFEQRAIVLGLAITIGVSEERAEFARMKYCDGDERQLLSEGQPKWSLIDQSLVGSV